MKVVKKEIPFAVFGGWEVWQDGTITSKYVNPVGRESPITIYPEALTEPDLILTMFADGAVDNWNDFMPAFLAACKLAKVKKIKNFMTAFE